MSWIGRSVQETLVDDCLNSPNSNLRPACIVSRHTHRHALSHASTRQPPDRIARFPVSFCNRTRCVAQQQRHRSMPPVASVYLRMAADAAASWRQRLVRTRVYMRSVRLSAECPCCHCNTCLPFFRLPPSEPRPIDGASSSAAAVAPAAAADEQWCAVAQ